jgi:hypothetical protein
MQWSADNIAQRQRRRRAFKKSILTTTPTPRHPSKKRKEEDEEQTDNSPSSERYPTNLDYPPQNKSRSHANTYNSMDGVGRIRPIQQYPVRLARRACRVLRHRRRSLRRRWGCRPKGGGGVDVSMNRAKRNGLRHWQWREGQIIMDEWETWAQREWVEHQLIGPKRAENAQRKHAEEQGEVKGPWTTDVGPFG